MSGNANLMRTEYVNWYFGSFEHLARASGASTWAVRQWGEFVPAQYVEQIQRVIDRDALEPRAIKQ